MFDIVCPYLPERWREVLHCGRPHSDNTVSLDTDRNTQPKMKNGGGEMIHTKDNVNQLNESVEMNEKHISQKAVLAKGHASNGV